jgi:hypothetical protein
MGMLRSAIQQASADKQVTEETKETLALLMNMATQKMENWSIKLTDDLKSGKRNTLDDIYIPISKVVGQVKQTRAVTKTSMSSIVSETASTLGDMIGGQTPILTGVGKIIEGALNDIMGEGQGQEKEVSTYAVVAEEEAIVRYDTAFWGRNISSKSLMEHMESVFACVAIRSSVDCSKMDYSTFLAVVTPALRGAYSDADRKQKLQEAKTTFQACGGKIAPPGGLNLTSVEHLDDLQLKHIMACGITREAPIPVQARSVDI